MQHQTGRFSKEARAAAQLAFTKALAALEENEPLAPDERRFLVEQRPCGIDEVGRIVLEYPSESAAREAGLRAALTRIGRVLSERRLAAGVERTTIQPPRNRRKASGRSGPPISPILYLPTILASVTLPHKKVTGVEFRRMNGHLDVTMLAPSHIGLPYGVYPRLALMYLTTKAVLTRRRSFEVGESANDFLATMGIKDSGGAAGTSTRARDQLTRLTRHRVRVPRQAPGRERWSRPPAGGSRRKHPCDP